MRQVWLALAFLTRLPAPRLACGAGEIGRSARWFSLVGVVLGAIYLAVGSALRWVFPPLVAAVLLTVVDILATGAMHFDGLADSADGLGGGRTREDILRIMRDHAIGSYGACALCLAIGLKVAAISALVDQRALLLAPVLGRWSAVFSCVLARYARPLSDDTPKSVGSPARFIGRTELLVATGVAAVVVAGAWSWRGGVAWLVAGAVVAAWTWLCRRRIGGVTGDTLGAGIEISECIVLTVFTMRW